MRHICKHRKLWHQQSCQQLKKLILKTFIQKSKENWKILKQCSKKRLKMCPGDITKVENKIEVSSEVGFNKSEDI